MLETAESKKHGKSSTGGAQLSSHRVRESHCSRSSVDLSRSCLNEWPWNRISSADINSQGQKKVPAILS